ncbi:MAG: threonylcarbamoyl-AMP synthase [Chloroflexi bacterium]|nr:threonylcarbamoyl-AMP synthase [Chloroflexota bacterium]
MTVTQYRTDILEIDDAQAIASAVALLRRGEVIAFPTDTVYGVGCDPRQIEAVERLYRVKQRSLNMAIPLLVADLKAAEQVARGLSCTFYLLAERFWPGELTLVVYRQSTVPDIVTAGGDTVALRVPNHPTVLHLCRELGGALAVTSANISGAPACATAEEVFHDLGGRVPLILDGGRCTGGVASTIIDCVSEPPRLLRQGNLSLDLLRTVIPSIVIN